MTKETEIHITHFTDRPLNMLYIGVMTNNFLTIWGSYNRRTGKLMLNNFTENPLIEYIGIIAKYLNDPKVLSQGISVLIKR